ncbi:MAG: ATP synthase F1 subunit gamma [Parcubacteria group bacterium CG2_30_44_11]|nr:MAG: ATP synthase F1 subunit gamma [Parcubacteria group bacterium CG2_30_44_11]
MALKQIKNKIVATKKTGQVTKAMESVSAVKMRKSQERAFAGRPYVHAALRILARLAQSGDVISHPLIKPRIAGKLLAVIVTSDKGLAGSVNSAVLKQAEKLFATSETVDVVAIGRKAVEFAGREKKTILASYTNVSDGVTVADVYDMTSKIIAAFTDEPYQSVVVIYQNFISTFEQAPTVRKVLPLDTAEIHYIMQGIKPKVGKFSDESVEAGKAIAYTVEPSPEEVMDTLLPQLVQIMFYHAMLESKASEHSSRMVAMKNATDKAKEMVKALTIKFNNKRQAAITAEVSEITAGVESLK